VPIEIPFDVIEAMLAAMNEAIYSGRTTYQVLCAGIGAANSAGWVLNHDPEGSNAGMSLPDERDTGTQHVLINADDLTDLIMRAQKRR
jgi:hypothetical protein